MIWGDSVFILYPDFICIKSFSVGRGLSRRDRFPKGSLVVEKKRSHNPKDRHGSTKKDTEDLRKSENIIVTNEKGIVLADIYPQWDGSTERVRNKVCVTTEKNRHLYPDKR